MGNNLHKEFTYRIYDKELGIWAYYARDKYAARFMDIDVDTFNKLLSDPRSVRSIDRLGHITYNNFIILPCR